VAEGKPISLPDLPLGRMSRVATVDESLPELMEIGFVPGARVKPRYNGVAGGPRVYEVDGALVAVRRTAARGVQVLADQEGKEAED
jgi:Fe2+ transport system protein FeoA